MRFLLFIIFILSSNNLWAACNANQTIVLKQNGANNSTTFTDDAISAPLTWTARNGGKLNTATFKFGTAAGVFTNAGNDMITAPDSDYYPTGQGAGNWYIRTWIKISSTTGSRNYITGQRGLNGTNGFAWFINSDGTQRIIGQNSGGSTIFDYSTNSAITLTDAFHYEEITRNGTSFTLYLDGTSQALTTSVAIGSTALQNTDDLLSVAGNDASGAIDSALNGFLDDFEVGNVVGNTSNYTAPTTEVCTAAAAATFSGVSLNGRVSVNGRFSIK